MTATQHAKNWAAKNAEAENDLQVECSRIRTDTSEVRHLSWEHRATGLCTFADAHLRRLTGLLEAIAQADHWLARLNADDEATRLAAAVALNYVAPTNPSEAPFKLITLGENQ